MKKAQQQQQQQSSQKGTAKTSKLSRLQKLRMQSQRMHHGSTLQHTPHTFTSKSHNAPPLTSHSTPPPPQPGGSPAKGAKVNQEKQQRNNPPIARGTTNQNQEKGAKVKAVPNAAAKSSSGVSSSRSPLKNLAPTTKRDSSPLKSHRDPSPLAKTTSKRDSSPLAKATSKRDSPSLGKSKSQRDSSPLAKTTSKRDSPPLAKSTSHHANSSKSNGASLSNNYYHESRSNTESREMEKSSSLHVFSESVSTLDRSPLGSLTSSKMTPPPPPTTTKIIHGDRKYYSPIRSMGKMMPLMTEDPVKDHRKHHHHHHKHHHGSERSESKSSRGLDFDGSGSDGGGDLFAQKDAILAAKFPQKRNRAVPPLGEGGGGVSSRGVVSSSNSKHHRNEGHSHGRTNRT